MKNVDDFLLTSKVTVGQLRSWVNLKDEKSKKKIVTLIRHRFHERYINHVKTINSGFLKMAISCLMIETFESFKKGKKNTSGKSEKMFKSFFTSEKENFPGFKDISHEFYIHIRCGILHQAETTDAWRILLKGNLLEIGDKAINAKSFVESLEKSLNKYIADLGSKEWEDVLWTNALLKLDDICENCKTTQ